MSNYSTKMRVFQNFGTSAPGTATEQNVYVFGPQYALFRYTDPDEKAQLPEFAYEYDYASGSDTVVTDALKAGTSTAKHVLDEASVRVYAEDAYAATGAVLPALGEIEIVGSHYDGVLRLPGEVSGLVAGDYLVFQRKVSDELVSTYARVSTVAKDEDADAENPATLVTLATGLDDDLVDVSNGVFASGLTVFAARSVGQFELPSAAFSVADGEVTILDQSSEAAYAAAVDGEARPLVKATIYVGYRCLYTGASGSIEVFSSPTSVEDVLGPADPDNPVSMGVVNAFVGGAPVVYCYVTSGSDATAIQGALKRAESQKTLYYLVPMTNDKAALDAVVAHVKAMCNEEKKRWRHAVVCTPVSRETVSDCMISGFGSYKQGSNTYLTVKFTDPVDAVGGDTVSFEVGSGSSAKSYAYEVVRKLNGTTVLVDATYADAPALSGDTAATIRHTYTNMEYGTAVGAAAKAYNTFRVTDVFPKTYGYDGVTYDSMFMAPIIAGMAASVEPQAPITNMAIPAVDDLPDTYASMPESELDNIASYGVLIAMQELRGSNVYIRKQLTAGDVNNIVTSELSCVKNADSVSHQFSNTLESFKGSYNVTPGLLELVRLDLGVTLRSMMFNGTNELIGPQLLPGSEVRDVYVDPSNATRIIAYVHCVLPAPFNEMDLYLSFDVTTDVEATAETAVSTEA